MRALRKAVVPLSDLATMRILCDYVSERVKVAAICEPAKTAPPMRSTRLPDDGVSTRLAAATRAAVLSKAAGLFVVDLFIVELLAVDDEVLAMV